MDIDDAPQKILLVAEAAQDVAAGFHKFTAPVPQHAAEITEVIAKCFAISSALQNLAKAIKNDNDYRQGKRFRAYNQEISDVAYSVDYTFKDIHTFTGYGLRDAQADGLPQRAAFKPIWMEINTKFTEESQNRLARRLEIYHDFLLRLTNTMIEG